MRILFVPYGTDRAPATRYRVMQYLGRLKGRGIDFRVFSAISKFSTFVMIKSPDLSPAMRVLYYIYVFIERATRSFYIIAIAKRFDIIFLQRATFSFRLERLLKIANNNIIFDIDDAIYLPDKRENYAVTAIKKYIKQSEVINILKVSRAVIVENDYIKNFVSRYCKNIYKIPGPIDTERFFVGTKPEHDGIVIGWIGSPATTPYLHLLDNVFRDIKKKYDFIKFKFIGLGRYENSDLDFERINWNYNTEIENLQGFDIGIMPMLDNEWTRGKLGCKMLQYMAVGVPSVVSYTATNAEMIENGVNGFFVANDAEWTRVLSNLIEDKNLRREIAEKGRKTVEEKCSLAKSMDDYIHIWENLLKG